MRRLAILIGIDDNQDLLPLHFAASGVRNTAEVLKKEYGFKDEEFLFVGISEKCNEPVTNRDTFQRWTGASIPNLDLLIFGFWGNAVIRGGERYFCMRETNAENVETTGVRMSELLDGVMNLGANQTVFILDYCQSVYQRDLLHAPDIHRFEKMFYDVTSEELGLRQNQSFLLLESLSRDRNMYEWAYNENTYFTHFLLGALEERPEWGSELAEDIREDAEGNISRYLKPTLNFVSIGSDISLYTCGKGLRPKTQEECEEESLSRSGRVRHHAPDRARTSARPKPDPEEYELRTEDIPKNPPILTSKRLKTKTEAAHPKSSEPPKQNAGCGCLILLIFIIYAILQFF